MKTFHIEDDGREEKVYNSLLLEPDKLSIFGAELSVNIVNELAKSPQCAMDLARSLKTHEQTIYYHLNKLKAAGIIEFTGTEIRYGMSAKIYKLISPVISTKLYEDGHIIQKKSPSKDPSIVNFLEPFIKNGKLNAIIVVGNPYPHGPHEGAAMDIPHALSLMLYFGSFLKEPPLDAYRLDIDVTNDDMKKNMILLGGPKINIIVDRLQNNLPVSFIKEKEWLMVSKISNNTYSYAHDAVIAKIDNPVNKKNKVLWLAGKRSEGLKSAVLAFMQNTDEILKGNKYNKNAIVKIVTGIDRFGTGKINDIKIQE